MRNKTGNYFFPVIFFFSFDVFFRGFVCRSYAGAAKAVHASRSEASCYYQLPCFSSCIKKYR